MDKARIELREKDEEPGMPSPTNRPNRNSTAGNSPQMADVIRRNGHTHRMAPHRKLTTKEASFSAKKLRLKQA